jgi:hypothetical protein
VRRSARKLVFRITLLKLQRTLRFFAACSSVGAVVSYAGSAPGASSAAVVSSGGKVSLLGETSGRVSVSVMGGARPVVFATYRCSAFGGALVSGEQ